MDSSFDLQRGNSLNEWQQVHPYNKTVYSACTADGPHKTQAKPLK